ncbi:HD family phosphohydrolase [Betaproteobacteria bacterium]|nr:HD family phosphohydrolase [Betaproteobacteria bacterium]
MAKDKPSSDAHYISSDQLRIGLYVHVDLPWFKHPFTLNSFRIDSEEQIDELRALGASRFRYNPQDSGMAEAPVIGTSPAPSKTSSQAPSRAEPAEALSGKQERIHLLKEHLKRYKQVNKAFLESSSILRNLGRNLLTDSAGTMQEIGACVEQMAQAFLEHPEVTLHLISEEGRDEDIYSHHINIAVLSMMLARELHFSLEQTRILGQGALVHDIGLLKVPRQLLKKRTDEYTRQERELYAMHCEHGLEFGKKLGLPEDVLSIISQHHEMVDGSGYPRGIRGDQMTLPARIVSLVNYYERLCNPTDPAQAMTPHGALSLMFGQKRAKFDMVVLERLIRRLGVYPPGTIVTLSNDAIALVMSANSARPLRPWVMVYDPGVPKEEAILLDLEQETDINIVGTVRPGMLPPAVAAYLSPRKRVVYFFDSDDAQAGSKGEA